MGLNSIFIQILLPQCYSLDLFLTVSLQIQVLVFETHYVGTMKFLIFLIQTDKNNMIRELLEAKKKKISVRTNEINKEVENLTTKLNNIRKQQPNITINPLSFSVKMMSDFENKKNSLMLHETIGGSKTFRPSKKCKIIWNNSANIMTREQSPSHSIPHAKRFSLKKFDEDRYQQLQLTIPSTLNTKGVSFAKANRKQLWKNQMITPSPHEYNLKRYLQNLQEHPRSYISHLSTTHQQTEHIKGGSIGKFSQYESLYYPHTKKLNFNEKIISQSQHEKSRSLPYREFSKICE